ncbi:MAG: hypothetical protein WCA19_10895 [Candidatus Acidiferrales bacterium]
MSVTMLQSREVEETAEQKLWRAVIATTVEEWVSGPLRRSVKRNSSCSVTIRIFKLFAFPRESTPKIYEAAWKKFARARYLKRRHALRATNFAVAGTVCLV